MTDQPAPASLPVPSVAPPDTHRSTSNPGLEVLRCVSGAAGEGLQCGAGGIECASASADGAGTSGYESQEGSDWFEIGHGEPRLGKAGRRTITLVMPVSICGCELYSLCKHHSPERGQPEVGMPFARVSRVLVLLIFHGIASSSEAGLGRFWCCQAADLRQSISWRLALSVSSTAWKWLLINQ